MRLYNDCLAWEERLRSRDDVSTGAEVKTIFPARYDMLNPYRLLVLLYN